MQTVTHSRVIDRTLEAAGPGAIVVKTTSHRSRDRLRRVVPPLQGQFYSWQRDGAFYVIPAAYADAALAVTGVTRSRRHDDLNACIRMND